MKMLGLLAPPLLAVGLVTIVMAVELQKELNENASLREFLAQSENIHDLVASIQKERGLTCIFLNRFSFEDFLKSLPEHQC